MTSSIEVAALLKPLVTTFKALSDEWDNLFELGLTEYLHSQTDKYYFTNTFIHRNEKIRFRDIYYPLKANYKELTTDFTDLESIFEEYNNITIIGSAGSGKTTIIKHIFLQTVSDSDKIPILIELRYLNEFDGNLDQLIVDKVLNARIKPNDSIFKRALRSGKFLFLLDGYDEIFSLKKQEINRQIEMFVDSYPKNRFVLTTRPGSGIESFPRFHNFQVCSLDNHDVIAFISKIVNDVERKERISKLVVDPGNSNYFEFLRNPLLLSMFILAFENHPEIPKRKSAFYRNVFDTLYSRHDGITKNSFPRERRTKLQRDDFEYILCVFSYLTLLEGQYSFTHEALSDTLKKVEHSTDYEFVISDLIYDLWTTISVLVLDGFEYHFPHRSMQEYFTALFINKLPTDKKHKAYKNLATILEQSSNDHSFNFWSLCFELDETTFISNFLIPQLKKAYKLLENKKGEALLDSYFDLIQPVILYVNFEPEVRELRIFRNSNFQGAIIEFCDVYDFAILWKSPVNNVFHDKLYDVFQSKTIRSSDKNALHYNQIKGDKELYDIFISHGVIEIIETYRQKILDKINQWDIDVQRKKSNIDNLRKL
jgi:hypothetical protein